MIATSSTSNFGFFCWIFGLATTIWLAQVLYSWRFSTEGKQHQGIKLAVARTWRRFAADFLAITVFTFFVWLVFVVRTIYLDHITAIGTIKNLSDSVTPLRAQIENLKDGLTKTCYMPDRRLTQTQRDVLHESLKLVADKYNHPRIDIGYFDGDMESERYWMSIYFLFKDAGFILPDADKCIRKPQHRTVTDPPDLGFKEDLSIQVFVQQKGDKVEPRNQLRLAIDQAFLDAGMKMQQYPIGTGELVKGAKEVIIWVGIKRADWLATTRGGQQ